MEANNESNKALLQLVKQAYDDNCNYVSGGPCHLLPTPGSSEDTVSKSPISLLSLDIFAMNF